MLLDTLLAYVEMYDREEEMEEVAKLLGVCFHVLDGEDDGGKIFDEATIIVN